MGIENKKQKRVSLLATDGRANSWLHRHFHISFCGSRWRRSEPNIRFSHSRVGENRTRNENHWGRWRNLITRLEQISLHFETEQQNRRSFSPPNLPNSFKYWNIHKKKRDSSSPSPFFFFNSNYTGYNKQVTNFLYLKTETLAGGDVTKYVGWRVRNTFFRDRKEHWRLGTRTEVEEPFPKRYLPAILRFLNSALTLWAFCIPFKKKKKKNKGCFSHSTIFFNLGIEKKLKKKKNSLAAKPQDLGFNSTWTDEPLWVDMWPAQPRLWPTKHWQQVSMSGGQNDKSWTLAWQIYFDWLWWVCGTKLVQLGANPIINLGSKRKCPISVGGMKLLLLSFFLFLNFVKWSQWSRRVVQNFSLCAQFKALRSQQLIYMHRSWQTCAHASSLTAILSLCQRKQQQ